LQFFSWIGTIVRILLKYLGFVLLSTLAIGFVLPKEGEPTANMAVILLSSLAWLVMPIALTIWSEKERAKKRASNVVPPASTNPQVSSPALFAQANNLEPSKASHPQVGNLEREKDIIAAREKKKVTLNAAPPMTNNPWSGSAPSFAPVINSDPLKFTHPQVWVPKGQKVTIAGREIDGMIYVGTAPTIDRGGYGQKCRAYVDPKLAVAQIGRDPNGSQMSYWPAYHDINPVCRATYLDWLSGGRNDGSVNAGYLFLFFYGLERRFLVEKSDDCEKRQILIEVERLRLLFQTNHSAYRYLSDFLALARVKLNSEIEIGDALVRKSLIETRSWELPLTLRVGLGKLLGQGQTLSAEWLYTWFMCHQERRLRTPAERCAPEFEALFLAKSRARFPLGHKISPPKKKLVYHYRAASSEFNAEVDLGGSAGSILDVSGLHAPIKAAQQLADEAMDELDKFSRYLGRNQNGGRDSIEAQALLPAILWDKFPSNKMIALSTWAADVVVNGGLIPVSKVFEQIQGAAPDPSWKRQLADGADALARLGFGMAPDLRHSLRSPTQTEPVVIFDLGQEVEQIKKTSPEYLAVLVDITLAAFIAHADKKVVEAERRALYDKVTEATGITDIERRTLKAHVDWYLEVPPDLSIMGSKLKDADADQQALFRAIVVASAHADGIIQSEEVARIERVYKALGLDQALAYSDLHAGKKRDELAVMRKAEADAPGEKIPVAPKLSVAPLNVERIAEIQADTARVSMVLGKIFSGDEEVTDVAPSTPTSPLVGLDQKHADFVGQIIQQSHWSESDFDKLAKSGGLMPSGALEVINEWSFQNFGDGLLDVYEGYDVAPEIAATLRAKLAMEN
jgi:uncharacterized membrane protein YebE (DUF533 family)